MYNNIFHNYWQTVFDRWKLQLTSWYEGNHSWVAHDSGSDNETFSQHSLTTTKLINLTNKHIIHWALPQHTWKYTNQFLYILRVTTAYKSRSTNFPGFTGEIIDNFHIFRYLLSTEHSLRLALWGQVIVDWIVSYAGNRVHLCFNHFTTITKCHQNVRKVDQSRADM